jgi:hypothetical protein
MHILYLLGFVDMKAYKAVGEVLSSYSKWFLSNAGPNLRQLL